MYVKKYMYCEVSHRELWECQWYNELFFSSFKNCKFNGVLP